MKKDETLNSKLIGILMTIYLALMTLPVAIALIKFAQWVWHWIPSP